MPESDQRLHLALRRNLKPSERGILWWMLGGLASLALVGVGVLLSSAKLPLTPEYYLGILRGYTPWGVILGLAGIALAGLAFAYSLRKRGLQETPLGSLSMMTWLWIHIWAGVAGLIAIIVHAGAGIVDSRITSGDIALWGALGVVVTGVFWRVVYRVVPPGAAAELGNYAEETNLNRAESQRMELEKVAAGGSSTLHEAKDWLLMADHTHDSAALESAGNQLPPEEHEVFSALIPLAASFHRAQGRVLAQRKVKSQLQRWRALHVPLSFLVVGLVTAHVLFVYRVPSSIAARFMTPKELEDAPIVSSGHHPSSACKDCHSTIYKQWKTSMHAHAMNGPVMVVQNNQVSRKILNEADSPDPARICVQCHSPVATTLADGNILPLGDTELELEGVGCTTCHQYNGVPGSAAAGFSTGMMKFIEPGPVMRGVSATSVGNSYHQTVPSELMQKDPTQLCQNCHNVHLDRDGDGKIDKGLDLVLQLTHNEYTEYRQEGGSATCMDCHMPLVRADNGEPVSRLADGAHIPREQDKAAPARTIRSHAFVAVDYPLNEKGEEEPNADFRAQLLRQAALMKLVNLERSDEKLALTVSLKNVGAGHDLPTGFAFARQMWLEVVVTQNAALVFSSGLLKKHTDDLCDAGTVEGKQKLQHMRGCTESDPQLVNFQKMLVSHTTTKKDKDGNDVLTDEGDHIAILAEEGREVSIQHVTGGAVLRTRPFDKQIMSPMHPGETKSFDYSIPVQAEGEISVRVRLLFRHLAPYFVRELNAGREEGEGPDLDPMVENIQTIEMAKETRVIE